MSTTDTTTEPDCVTEYSELDDFLSDELDKPMYRCIVLTVIPGTRRLSV